MAVPEASGAATETGALPALRRFFRRSEGGFIGLALLVGLIAGVLTLLQAGLAHSLQAWLYGFDENERLSSWPTLASGRCGYCRSVGCW